MKRVVEISLKIPDNTAYTALVALRRLGVDVARAERGSIYSFDDEGDVDALIARVETDETIFNPNTHRLTVRKTDAPERGEVWIEGEAAESKGLLAWRLYDETGNRVSAAVLDAAIERLLCNPAIERARTAIKSSAS